MTVSTQDPQWVLSTLNVHLIRKYMEAAHEWAQGRPALTDQDFMLGIAHVLSFLGGLTDGQWGLSPEQLSGIRDEAESEVAR